MTWKTRPLAAWQQADVPDVVSKSLIKPAIGDGMEALKIGIDAPEPAWAQQQTQRVAGTIDKVEGKTLYIKSASGPVTLTLADNAVIVARVKATAADIRAGDYVASGGVPQPDGLLAKDPHQLLGVDRADPSAKRNLMPLLETSPDVGSPGGVV
jgi:hypothetical protein